jgi:hypothetical protein
MLCGAAGAVSTIADAADGVVYPKVNRQPKRIR